VFASEYVAQAEIDQEGRKDDYGVTDEIGQTDKHHMFAQEQQEVKHVESFRLVLLFCSHCLPLHPKEVKCLGMEGQLDLGA